MVMNDVIFYALMLEENDSGNQTISGFLEALGNQIQHWGARIVFVLGGVMMIAGIWFVAKGLMSQGRGQTNWALTIALIVLGGALMASSGGGWNILNVFSNSSQSTLNSLAGGQTDAEGSNDQVTGWGNGSGK
jgi:hypothetical protein